jgi:copper chaperone CopZ
MNNWKRLAIALTNLLMAVMLVSGAQAAGVQRTSYIVSNLSCASCLATIEAELKGLPGTIGMDADLQQGRVTVDHLPSLNYEQIATTISNLGYPAKVDWSATVPEQYTKEFAQQSKYSSGCSSGGCSTSGGTGAGPTTWKTPPATGTINRTTLQVSNLSCTSCLNNIAAEMSKLSDTYGMNGYLSRGIVIVDHTDALENSRIAAIISDLGYPAKCNSKGPCNATSSSWQKLYNRYFTQTNSK